MGAGPAEHFLMRHVSRGHWLIEAYIIRSLRNNLTRETQLNWNFFLLLFLIFTFEKCGQIPIELPNIQVIDFC